jgi:hypothetical protein
MPIRELSPIGMQHRAFLDVRRRADGDRLVIAAQHCTEPDADVDAK